ncbi:MFS transporter [Pseudaquabacterium pictum]|uniref:MFS transporter n=1 Tax=Pseudaquabacterium pictum TaxID=2315236 RepID=A0A480AY07_9BURK|nr:MFS transporter [Rubrivivax pictus]GCL65806.1 MFS transporter [Rubrivivax pictus]
MTNRTLSQPVGAASSGFSLADGLRYGALGAPLAFAALPLYVLLPNHYAAQLGVPLAGLGAVLLGTRALDALIDPWLGRMVDAGLARPRRQVLAAAAGAALLMALGFAALFFPQVQGSDALLAWCAVALVVTCLGYSALGVLHQAWGARLGGGATAQARITGWREGLSLAGVLAASVLPALAGVPVMVVTCITLLALAIWALSGAPFRAAPLRLLQTGTASEPGAWLLPWRTPAFRRLMAVFLLNGVASAIPATLVIFFIRDRLQAPAWEPAFLGSYFAAAALSMPLWVRAVARFGLLRCWLAGMGLAIAAFMWAARLGSDDTAAFLAICIASGVALGADLAVPGALLTGVIQRAGHALRHEGNYFGWWTCANKLNLALAAGLALPALQWLGYAPGATDPTALNALAVVYAAVPCLLKAGAAGLLWTFRTHLDRP